MRRVIWIALLLAVVLIFCTLNHRWSARQWFAPAGYGGDAWWELAHVKALATGEIVPVLPKYPRSLGAPFGGNWNDHPSVEEGINAWLAMLALMLGLFGAENVALLSAHLFSAAAFYYVCHRLRYDPLLSAAGALLFSYSHYAFFRGLSHLTLTYYWHVPLAFLVVGWCLARAPFAFRSKKGLIAVAVAVAHGVQSPYYTGLFLQFLVWAAIICAIQRREWSRVLIPLTLCGIMFGTFFLMNVDTFYHRLLYGPNHGVVQRNYSGVEIYALKPLELIVPAQHRIDALERWTTSAYVQQAQIIGETGSPYLGIVALGAFAALLWQTLRAIAVPRRFSIPPQFWAIAWILAYSVVGGGNGLLGLSGMVLFRCTNRYSIAIHALLLLFAAGALTRFIRRRQWRRPVIAAFACGLALIGLWDQSDRALKRKDVGLWSRMSHADRQLTDSMEARLETGAMVFQLPVMDCPENGPIHQLTDYEQFRPYFFSHDLRFSYGTNKGRPQDEWQHDVKQLTPARMVEALERYGFAAILIARDGYEDRGATLLAKLDAAGRATRIAQSHDFVCIALQPAADPLLPPTFNEGWSVTESAGDRMWRWSSGNASIILHHQGSAARQVHLRFSVATLQKRELAILLGTEHLTTLQVEPGGEPVPVELRVTLRPGQNKIAFMTDVRGESGVGGDPRQLAFQVIDFAVLP